MSKSRQRRFERRLKARKEKEYLITLGKIVSR